MNVFQRIGAALARQVDRENAATSGTASAEAATVLGPIEMDAAADWRRIADDLAFTLGRLVEAIQSEWAESENVRLERLNAKARLQVYNAAARREEKR